MRCRSRGAPLQKYASYNLETNVVIEQDSDVGWIGARRELGRVSDSVVYRGKPPAAGGSGPVPLSQLARSAKAISAGRKLGASSLPVIGVTSASLRGIRDAVTAVLYERNPQTFDVTVTKWGRGRECISSPAESVASSRDVPGHSRHAEAVTDSLASNPAGRRSGECPRVFVGLDPAGFPSMRRQSQGANRIGDR